MGVLERFDTDPAREPQWYVIHAKPRKELQVYSQLRASKQAIDVYYPSMTVEPVNPRCSRIRPYFPGYLFARAVLAEIGESALRWIPGAQGLVRFGGEPAIVPENFVLELKRRIAAMERDGDQHYGLKPGDRIRVVEGPFADCEGIFDGWRSGEERAQLLLTWLGRQLKVTAPARQFSRLRS